MTSNSEAQLVPVNPQATNREANDRNETIRFQEETDNLSTLLKRATSQANLNNWKAVLADAITAREMDPRSAEAWKLCARAGLAGGDLDSALDCLHEALLIDNMDREACDLLRGAVEDHMNKTLEVRTLQFTAHLWPKRQLKQ